MMTAKEKLQRASASVAFDGIFKYIKKEAAGKSAEADRHIAEIYGRRFPREEF